MSDEPRRIEWRAIIGIVAALAAAVWIIRAMDDDGNDAAADRFAEQLAPVEITYHVTGSADSVDITIETPTGTQQAADRAVPLSTDDGLGLTMTFDPGAFLYISAQNNGESGTVSCRIVGSDGEVISQNTSDGAYTIASCDGTAR